MERNPLRYEMAPCLGVMGPDGLVFYGVILTPSFAFPRQVLVMARRRSCTDRIVMCV